MNMITVAWSDLASFKSTSLPLTASIRIKGGAGVPSGTIVEGIAMLLLLSKWANRQIANLQIANNHTEFSLKLAFFGRHSRTLLAGIQ
jgi:hypothetical protein